MQWFNYLAETVATPLSGNALLNSGTLLQRIAAIPDKTSAYHCYYDLEERETFVGYQGLMRPVFDTIHIDLDSESDRGAAAWEDAKKLCTKLQSENVEFSLYFSGNKGFHVSVPASAIGIKEGPKEILEAQVRCLLTKLKPEFPTVDLRIWNANRKFRADGSMHEKTSLYKIRLTGRGLSLKNMSIDDIRTLAEKRFLDPAQLGHRDAVNPWLGGLIAEAQAAPVRNAPSLKLIPTGQMVEDDAAIFAHFKGKKCTAEMLTRRHPNFNRHDIAMRVIYDLYATGTPEAKCEQIMQKWAVEIHGAGTDRAADMTRLVRDAYHKPQTYVYGCYDDVKKAYCSAKCGLFKKLSPSKRAEPVDMTEKQRNESKEKGPSESEIVEAMISARKDLCTRSDEVFRWVDTHWKRLDRESFDHELFLDAKSRLGESATSGRIESVRTHVFNSLPRAPEENNLFNSPIGMFNFQDGTYHVKQGDDGKVHIEKRDHSPADFLSYCSHLPLRGSTDLPRNGSFREFLELRKADQPTPEMGEQVVRALKQILGACFMPYAPITAFLVGESNSGKSTTINLMTRLVGAGNWSTVDPCDRSAFSWETAVGKVMNICTELDRTQPLNDSMLKKARDKMPVFIQRKFKQNIQGVIPCFQVYACNELPPSVEGNTGALKNRFIVFEFKKGYLNGKSGISDLASFYWDTDAGTVLDVAREGLEDLIASDFKYFVPDAAKENLEAWETNSDPVGLFLKDLRSGQTVLNLIDQADTSAPCVHGGFILGNALYEQFKTWCDTSGYRHKMTRHRFFNALRKRHKVDSMDRGFGGVRFNLEAVCPGNATVQDTAAPQF